MNDEEYLKKSKLAFNLSHSSIELLDKCSYAFYLRYVLKFYPEGLPPNYSTEYGQLFHDVCEVYTGTGEQEVYNLIAKYKPKYQINDEYEKKIPLGVRNFLFFWNKYLVGAKKIYREKKIQVFLNEFLGLNGLLDVLYRLNDGSWIIADWKSSKKRSNYSAQLSCYFYLLSLISKEPMDKIKCQVVYLCAEKESGITEEYNLTIDDRDDYENRILSAVDRLSKMNVEDPKVWRMKPGPLCPWCDYYLERGGICEGNKNLEK
jgi:hypothetical protein